MRSVIESPIAMAVVDDAQEQWDRFNDAWEVVTWVLAKDPTAGMPLVEGGHLRSMVFDGSLAHDMPTIQVLYEITDDRIIIQNVRITNATTTAGNA